MRSKTIFGALLVSVALLSSQGFGFELLDNMLGLNRGGCGGCEPACCEKACCEKACCEPQACEPQCGQSCCKDSCDLFAGLKGLLSCNSCCQSSCCEADCCEAVSCNGCGGGAPAAAPTAAGEAAPLPPAPKADDPTASRKRGGVRSVSRVVVSD